MIRSNTFQGHLRGGGLMSACSSAHARNGRGCRKIEAVNATVLPRGALKNSCVWAKRKTTVRSESLFNFYHRAQGVNHSFFFQVLDTVDYPEVTRKKPDANVSNTVVRYRSHLVSSGFPLPFPFLGLLEVPLLLYLLALVRTAAKATALLGELVI